MLTTIEPWKEVVAGGVAGTCEHLAMYPFDTIKTRIQRYEFGDMLTALKCVIRKEGTLRLYRGWTAMVYSAFPAHAAYFSCYECAKRKIGATRTQDFAFAAVFSTVAHDTVSVPFDVVKQHMQVERCTCRSSFSVAEVHPKNGRAIRLAKVFADHNGNEHSCSHEQLDCVRGNAP